MSLWVTAALAEEPTVDTVGPTVGGGSLPVTESDPKRPSGGSEPRHLPKAPWAAKRTLPVVAVAVLPRPRALTPAEFR